jgi:imidazolonepropionase-like amidohydrolase
VIFGSDTIFPISEVPREFACMVRLGLSNLAAIRAATLNAATALGMEQEFGSLEVGHLADIVATSKNPLEDITTLEQVRFVMKGGQIIRNDSAP